MRDQAAHLRSLVLRSMRERAAEAGHPTRLVAITGGAAGVGTTTVAVNLAVALAQNGSRVVLVDANLADPAIASACLAIGSENVADVLAGRRHIHEVLQLGPAGIQIVAGTDESSGNPPPLALHRLIRQLKTLGRHAEVVIVDVGHGASEMVKSFWEAADDVVLVSGADDESVTASYATIKSIALDEIRPPIRLLLNRVDSADVASGVSARMIHCTRENLQIALSLLGLVPADKHAAKASLPLFVQLTDCPTTQAFQSIAQKMIGEGDGRLADVA